MPSTVTTTVQNIVDAVSQDVRGLLGNSGGDLNILIDYTNRVHEDILRKTRWTFLKSNIQTFTTVAGTAKYYIGNAATPSGFTNTGLSLSDVQTIAENVMYDRTNFRQITRIAERPLYDLTNTTGYPQNFLNMVDQPYGIEIYPSPNGAYSIEFRYFKERRALTAASDILQIPDDYKDIVIAGVTARAFQLLKMPNEAADKQNEYMAGITKIISDSHLFPKSNDFIKGA